jgi:hypothetical protein
MKVIEIKIIALLALTVLVLNCASTKKESRETPPPATAEDLDESFDPMLLNDDDIEFEKPKKRIEMPDPIILPPDEYETEQADQENKLIDGFRIQITSTKDLENAAKVKSIAAEQFEDLNVRFYLEFDTPYYKVRVGDFPSRDKAENFREIIRSRGYPKAWIVKTKVWSNPELQAAADTTQVDSPEFE